jgi:hypothetical protein
LTIGYEHAVIEQQDPFEELPGVGNVVKDRQNRDIVASGHVAE